MQNKFRSDEIVMDMEKMVTCNKVQMINNSCISDTGAKFQMKTTSITYIILMFKIVSMVNNDVEKVT